VAQHDVMIYDASGGIKSAACAIAILLALSLWICITSMLMDLDPVEAKQFLVENHPTGYHPHHSNPWR
jgi:hypothetical protein